MLRLLFFSLVLLTVSALKAQETAEIKQLIDNKRYSSAEKLLEQKVQSGSETPEINYLLVSAYLQQDKPVDAKTFLEQKNLAEDKNNSDPFNRIAYASYLISIDKQEKAKEIFDEILEDKKAKKDVGILSAIAEAYINAEQGDANEALKVIEVAEKRDKNNAGIQVLKGNAYKKMLDGSNAYVAYQTAIKDDPNNLEAHYQLGKIFVTQKSEDLYLEHFMKAYAIDSTYAPVLDELYDHYYYKDVKTAKMYLEKLIRHSDYSIENEYSLADMYYLNKEYENAITLANSILSKEGEKAQPRLYKLIAYSYDELGDKEKAWANLEKYFANEKVENMVSRDYEFKARLMMDQPDMMTEAMANYEKAFELDTLAERKTDFAIRLAEGYGKIKDYSAQAKWLGKVYELKEDRTNVDLFNWGLAHYKAGEFQLADTVFAQYTTQYPENIFGFYWRATVNAAIDTTLEMGLAVPYYKQVIELGEADKKANKTMLLKAYGYLGGYEANTTKDYPASLTYFEKFLDMDPENTDASHYAEILKNWIENPEKETTEEADKNNTEENKKETGEGETEGNG